MITKMNLFFATPVRKKVEEDVRFAASPGLSKAIELPGEIIGATLLHFHTESTERAKAVGGQMWKHFQPGHHQHTELERAVSIAQRVEGIISFHQGCLTQLQVEMVFYRKGEKKCFFSKSFGVCLNTAEVFQPVNLQAHTYDSGWFWDRRVAVPDR